MASFHIADGARFVCRADFTTQTVLNVDFCDAARLTIPFHLSIRQAQAHAQSLVVVNRRDTDGWRREIAFPMDLPAGPVDVAVDFSPRRARVWVAGQALGQFDGLPRLDRAGRFFLRRGFPSLAQIALVDLDGPVVPGSLALHMPFSGPVGVHLTDALEVMLRGMGADAPAGATVTVEGFAEPIPAVLRRLAVVSPSGQREHALAAVLPGRVWQGGVARIAATLTGAGGDVLGQVALDRAGLARHIAGLGAVGAFAQDDRATLQAVEHAHHAGIVAQLDPATLTALAQAADRFGLRAFLFAGAALPGAATPPAPPVVPVAREAADRVTARLRQDATADALPLIRAELAALPTPVERANLIQRLTEPLCLNGQVRDLLRLRRATGLAVPDLTGASLWEMSVALPVLQAEGAFTALAAALARLAPQNPAWLVTPAIGWAVAEIARNAPDLDGRTSPESARVAALAAFLDLLDARADDYWGRTPCRMLIAATVALLRAAQTLPDTLAERSRRTALRVYGLTPGFWAQMAGSEPACNLAAAKAAFERIRAGAEGGTSAQALALALDHFAALGCGDVARFRRDLCGVGNLGQGAPGLDRDEAAIRALASPGAAAPDANTLTAARAGLAAAYREVPSAPHRAAVTALRTRAAAMQGAEDWQAMARAILPLAGPDAGFQGVGIGLDTVRGWLDRGATAAAEALLTALVPHVTPQAADACAPAHALSALRLAHPAVVLPPLGPRLPVAVSDQAADLRVLADPVQDTLLCLYSCRANLQTRVQTIRDTWLPRLRAMGVPALVFVGDGDGRRDGDVVPLDAPDDYEGLPQKSLAMARWVLEHTGFAHLVKVDDDCLLDPDAWFADLAHRRADYHGRILNRVRGQMDRTWHMAKSRSDRGRLELDKSPEPSRYADGGSGYALSRRAMAALVDAAASPEGRELIHLSFMEDKLVGDLLALRAITVDNTDYRTSVLRRTHPGGPLVAHWENGFLPFAGSGIKLVHLDGHDQMAAVTAGLEDPLPRQVKIWPSFQPVRQGSRSNTLDLISPKEHLARVNAAPVAVVACLRNERFMMPRFLAHYRALGVTGFLIADNGSDDGTFEYLAEQPDVALFAVDTEYSQSNYGVAWQQALMANFRVGRWSLMADADELLFWNMDLTGALPALVQSPAFQGADAARVFMLDMYPKGPLAGADFMQADPFAQAGFIDRDPFLAVSGVQGPFSDAPIWTSALRHRLIPGSRTELFVAQKIALLKYQPWMRPSAGLHFVADVRLAQRELLFGHFKYNAAFHAKAQAEVARGQHFNNAEEYRKYLALASEGRDVIFDPAVSVRWQDSAFVQRICAGGAASE